MLQQHYLGTALVLFSNLNLVDDNNNNLTVPQYSSMMFQNSNYVWVLTVECLSIFKLPDVKFIQTCFNALVLQTKLNVNLISEVADVAVLNDVLYVGVNGCSSPYIYWDRLQPQTLYRINGVENGQMIPPSFPLSLSLFHDTHIQG